MTEHINVNNIITSILDNISIDLSKSPDLDNIFEIEKTIVKLVNNLNIIIRLYTSNFIYDNNIFNSLKNIKMSDYKHSYLLYYKKIRKTLGRIIFEIYRYSSYNILLSNIPTFAEPINVCDSSVDKQNNLVLVDSECMFDTVEHYIGYNTVDSVFQVSECSYLVKIKDLDNCKKLCDLINKKEINNNIIKVEYLDNCKKLCNLINEKEINNNIVEDLDNCKKLCNLINEKEINNNIVEVEYLEPHPYSIITFNDNIQRRIFEVGVHILYNIFIIFVTYYIIYYMKEYYRDDE